MVPAGIALASGVERLLIPINYNGPGAFGSRWKTLVALDNRANIDISAPGHTFNTCAPAAACADSRLPANSFGTLVSEAPHGVIFTRSVLPGGSGRLYGSVHIAAEPAAPRTAGTEIPVARDTDFSSTFVLPDVPTGPSGSQSVSTRSLLRIYALDRFELAEAVISVYSASSPNDYRGGASVQLTRADITKAEPMYADLDLSRFASLGKFVTIVVDGGRRLPLTTGDSIKVWGFVTVTDNATNSVITISPRPSTANPNHSRRDLLIPLNFNAPGAFGAKWHTTAVVNNLTNYDLYAGGALLFDTCGPNSTCSDLRVPEGSSALVASEKPHGAILNTFTNIPYFTGDIFASVHIAAEPRDPRTAGTEIPLARDTDFLPTFAITNAPTGPLGGRPTRSLLRIYSLDSFSNASAFVSVYSQASPPVLLALAEVKMTGSGNVNNRSDPLYGEIDLAQFASTGQFVNLVVDGGSGSYQVVPQVPQTGNLNIWGFVTITDNASNDVITITAR